MPKIAEELHRSLLALHFTDQEVHRIMLNASKEASRQMAILAERGTMSSSVRSAQLAMAKMNAEMWGHIGDATKVGIGDAVWNAAEAQALFDEGLFAKAGFTQTYWRASMTATAAQGVENLVSRKVNGKTLSQNIWRNQALSKGYLDRALNNGLLLGKTPAEIAKDVIGYVNPNVPGGASYAAKRLARTEVVNAYHTTRIRQYQATPWIETVKWNLSESHGRPDACNDYADSTHFPNGEMGEFLVMEAPGKPHPNCLCYLTPVPVGIDAFVKNFQSGKYDNYIQEQMGCFRGG